MQYNVGPNTDPCGTPHVKIELTDSALPTATFRYGSLVYDCSHTRALSVMPNECSSHQQLVIDCVKCADKSSITRFFVNVLSSAAEMSFLPRSSAVSVEWPR